MEGPEGEVGGEKTREAGGPMDGGNGDPLGDGIWETPGDWYVQDGDDVTYRNLTIMVNGDLFVESGANLTVDNTTLIVNTTAPLSHGVEVSSGARLDIINGSSVTAVTGGDRTKLTYWPGSAGSVMDSALSRMGHTSSAFYRGARLGSGDVTVMNCTISDSYYGLYIVACDPILTNVTVRDNDFGIYVTLAASPDITGCTLVDNKYGIHITGDSAPTILGTTVTGPITNISGISINSNSTPTIRDCEVSGFSHWGISITHTSSPYLRNVTVTGLPETGYCIRAEGSSPYIRECNVAGGWQGISLENCTAARVWSNTVNDTQATAIYSLGGTDGSFKWNGVGGAGTQGIWLRGGDHLVQYNSVSASGGHGIHLEEGFFNFTWENRVDDTNWTGILTLNASADLRGNVVDGAAGNGYDLTGGEVRLWNCHSYNSTGHGLMLTNGTFDVDETTAVGNGGWGVYMLNGTTGSVATDLTLGLTGFADNAIGGYLRDVYIRVRCVDVFGEPVQGMGITVADRFGTFTHSYLPSMEPELETGPDGRTALFNVSLHLLENDGVTGRTLTPHTLATLLPPGPGYYGNYTNVTVTGFTEVVMVMEYTVGPFVEVNQTINYTILARFGGLLEENATAPLAEGDIVELNVTLHRWDYPSWPGVVVVPWNLTANEVEVRNGTFNIMPPGGTNHTLIVPWVAVNGSQDLRFSIEDTIFGSQSRALEPPASSVDLHLDVNSRPRAIVTSVNGSSLADLNGTPASVMTVENVTLNLTVEDDGQPATFRFDLDGEESEWIDASELTGGTFTLMRLVEEWQTPPEIANESIESPGENGTNVKNGSSRASFAGYGLSLWFQDDGLYPIRVQAIDSDGSLGPWSGPIWMNVSNRAPVIGEVFQDEDSNPWDFNVIFANCLDPDGWVATALMEVYRIGASGAGMPDDWDAAEVMEDPPFISLTSHRESFFGNVTIEANEPEDHYPGRLWVGPARTGGYSVSFGDDGSYLIHMTFEDDDGLAVFQLIPLLVPNNPPTPSFSVIIGEALYIWADFGDGLVAESGQPVNFFALREFCDVDDSDGECNFSWDLDANADGDGNGNFTDDGDLFGMNVNHSFASEGNYTVSLTVTDDDGTTGMTQVLVSVVVGDIVEPDGEDGDDFPDGPPGSDGGGRGWLDSEGALVLSLFILAAVLISILLFLFIMKKRGHVFFWKDYLTRDPGFRVPVDGLEVSLAGRVDIIILKQTDAEKFRKYEMFHHAEKETPYVGVLWLTDKNEEWFIQDAVAGDLDDVVVVLNGNIDRFVAGEYRIHHYGNGTILSPDRQKEDRDEAGKPLRGELMTQAKEDSLERARRREELAKGEETLLLKGGKEDKPTKDDLLKKAVDDSHERAERREAARRGKEDEGKKDEGEGASKPSRDDLLADLGR